ncbi:mediator complex subunit MED7 [Besnoitia besnoiti]|uniref:Mediator of RNA polymerase II transcription subunit 7 n=1 Tax=Besnoitia besnoiti TaxID=94643 RepID=A0A2A9M9B7_BESBE|nr:mediator complex subunit MED7 [Besnoitia besnoiti]PFH32506.1 mediator complex subunit MED7 [Besnoitia besnoiti]
MAALNPGNPQQYVTGFPPPPFFYLEYGKPAETEQGRPAEPNATGATSSVNGSLFPSWFSLPEAAQDGVEDEPRRRRERGLLSAWMWGGRPPPEPVKDFWTAFGATYSEAYSEPVLDSDTKLYVYDESGTHEGTEEGDRTESAAPKPAIDLKDEFKRLYSLYVQEALGLLDSLARGGGDGGQANKWRKVVKLHKNLLHILLKLRTFQAEDEVLERLTRQLEKRREAADGLKRGLAAAVSLLDQQNAVAAPQVGEVTHAPEL